MTARLVVVPLDELERMVRRAVDEALEAHVAPPAVSDWIGDEEAASILGMRVSSFRKRLQPSALAEEAAALGGLPVHTVGRRRRFRRSEVEGWLARREPRAA